VGGLGNQLFSYATARSLALRNGVELRVDTVSGFVRDRVYQREHLLDRFAVEAFSADSSDCFLGFTGRLRREWLRRWNQRRPLHRRRYVQEQGFMPELLSFRVCDTVWLEGYWQDQRYFVDAEPVLRREFRLSVPLSEEDRRVESEILSGLSIGVHIRTFREISQPQAAAPSPPPYYYEAAVREALAQEPGARVYCFGDDLDWVRANLRLPEPVTLVTHNLVRGNAGAPFDLWLLSRCQHLVLSNSTFSWWAAWLADREGSAWISADHSWPHTVSLPKTLRRMKR
jgi:hypothetical protein